MIVTKAFHRLKYGRNASQRRFLLIAVGGLVLYMAFWTLFHLLWGFALAFFEYSPRRAGGPFLGLGGDNPFIGLGHFKAMLDFAPDAPLPVRQFHTGLKVTILFALLVVPMNLMITLPLAVMIESIHKRLKPIFRTIFFLPVLAPAVGVAIMWGFIYHPQRGLLNAIIGQFAGKLVGINWLGDPNLKIAGIPVALFAVIIAYLFHHGMEIPNMATGMMNRNRETK
jgi:ABC-type sugar transport system permease subunit